MFIRHVPVDIVYMYWYSVSVDKIILHASEEIEQLVVVEGQVPKVGIRQTDEGSPSASRSRC